MSTGDTDRKCFCQRCLYVFGVALLVFVLSLPAAILSHEIGKRQLAVAFSVAAAVGLFTSTLSLIVNCMGILRKGCHCHSEQFERFTKGQ